MENKTIQELVISLINDQKDINESIYNIIKDLIVRIEKLEEQNGSDK